MVGPATNFTYNFFSKINLLFLLILSIVTLLFIMKKIFLPALVMVSISAAAQNVGIGTLSPADLLDVNGNARAINLHIPNSGSIDLGYGIAGKEQNAGRIGYALFTSNAIDIVGGGTGSNNRRIRFWSEGGSIFTGGASFNGNIAVGTANNTHAKLEIHGRGGYSHNLSLIDSSTYNAGSVLFANVARPSTGLMLRGSSFGSATGQNLISFASADGNTLLLTVRCDGKVGVMQVTPAYTFDVGGDINFSGALYAAGSAGTSGKVLQSNGTASPGWVSPTASLYRNTFFDTLANDVTVPANSASLLFNKTMTLADSAIVQMDVQAFFFLLSTTSGTGDLEITCSSATTYTCESRKSLSENNNTLTTNCSFKLPAGTYTFSVLIKNPGAAIGGTVYKYFNRDFAGTMHLATTLRTQVIYR